MADQSTLIVQVPPGSAVERQLSMQPPGSVASGEVVVEVGPTDATGHLQPSAVGEVALSQALDLYHRAASTTCTSRLTSRLTLAKRLIAL
jgi:hypothetical protein